MICEDCIKCLHTGHGIIQFCYNHQHAKKMRDLLEEFSTALDEQTHATAWAILRHIQKRVDALIYKV